VRYVWLAIIGVTLAPVALVAFLANPIVVIVLGPEAWRERVGRLYPYRWWLGSSLVICAIATAVWAVSYA
jgi:hypothetical protein